MEQNVVQINGGVTINIDVTVTNIIYLKKIMFRILVYVIMRVENI